MLIEHISEAVGKTPLLRIPESVTGIPADKLVVYAKLEHLNPFGSLKDRPAIGMLSKELEGIAARGETVIDTSSGNMAKAMALLCSIKGVNFRIVSNRIKVPEVKRVLQLLGVHIDEFPDLAACPDPSDPNSPDQYIERIMAAEPGAFYNPQQFFNPQNPNAHYQGTGQEIFADGGAMDFLLAGVGTAGSSQGVSRLLKEKNPSLETIGVIAAKGQQVPGIRSADYNQMNEIGLFDKSLYSHLISVSTEEAIDGALSLIRQCGVMSGISAGAQFAALVKHFKPLAPAFTEQKKVVFIVCDRAEWYLSIFQKYRPELFALPSRRQSVRTVTDEEAQAAPRVSVEEATEWLDAGAIVVDMRGMLGYTTSHIPGAIHMSTDELADKSEWGLPFSTKHKVLFVCPIGEESRKFAAFFSRRGLDCASLDGGFEAWLDSDGATERAARQNQYGEL
jgi:Cysteine synthase